MFGAGLPEFIVAVVIAIPAIFVVLPLWKIFSKAAFSGWRGLAQVVHCRQLCNAFLSYSMNENRSLSVSVWPALIAFLLVAIVPVSGASAQTPEALWVVQLPDEIVSYDPATFVPRRTIRAPARVVQYPEYLAISGIGQMLFRPPRFGEWPSRFPSSPGHSTWFWDGHKVTEWQMHRACVECRGLVRQ